MLAAAARSARLDGLDHAEPSVAERDQDLSCVDGKGTLHCDVRDLRVPARVREEVQVVRLPGAVERGMETEDIGTGAAACEEAVEVDGLSNATVSRRMVGVAGGGRGGTLRAKLMPTVRSRSMSMEHSVPSQSGIDQLDTVESSAGFATRTTGDSSAVTEPEQREPQSIGPPAMVPWPSPAMRTVSTNCFAVGAGGALAPQPKTARYATKRPSSRPKLPRIATCNSPPRQRLGTLNS